MKKALSLCALFIFLLLPSITLITYAHPGRTDSRGGHTNHSTGEYHYHHGYSAHDHYDMDGDGVIDCPYDFRDNTDHENVQSKSNTEYTPNNTTAKKDHGLLITIVGTVLGYAALWIAWYFLFV